jgi:hypothetical protein
MTYSLPSHCTGPKWRLPPPPRLRPLWCWKENKNSCYTERTLRSRCRKDQDRQPNISDDLEPQIRIQHCSISLSSRNHTFRCWKLRSCRYSRPPERSSSNPTSRPVRPATVQSRRYKRSRSSDERCASRIEKDHGEI